MLNGKLKQPEPPKLKAAKTVGAATTFTPPSVHTLPIIHFKASIRNDLSIPPTRVSGKPGIGPTWTRTQIRTRTRTWTQTQIRARTGNGCHLNLCGNTALISSACVHA